MMAVDYGMSLQSRTIITAVAAAGETIDAVVSSKPKPLLRSAAAMSLLIATDAHCLSSTPEQALAYAVWERAMGKDAVALAGLKPQ